MSNSAFNRALDLYQSGNYVEAKKALKVILLKSPLNPDVLFLAALTAQASGATEEALNLYKKILKVFPGRPHIHYNVALLLSEIGHHREAIPYHEKAIQLDPKNPLGYVNKGVSLVYLNELHSALDSFQVALSLNPNSVEAWSNQGNVFRALKLFDKALISYDKALSLNPNHAEAWSNRGIALNNLQRHDEALASYDKALAINPRYVEAWSNRAVTLGSLQRIDDALISYDKALGIDANFVEGWSNRGITFDRVKRYDEALASYDKALAVNPSYATAWAYRGITFSNLRRYDDALSSYEKAIGLQSDVDYCYGNWLHTKMMLCDWREFDEAINKIFEQIEIGKKTSNPFNLLATPISPALLKKSAEIFIEDKFPSEITKTAQIQFNKEERIKIGYFSADFYNHATAYLIAELFERHDRSKFELIAFSYGPEIKDGMRQRIETAFDQFIVINNQSDKEIAKLAQNLGIHIAVDLKGFTDNGRTGIFSNRAAPIQVNYLGYPGTMAAPYMDYIIGDPLLIPSSVIPYYSEKIVYLPNSYQVNDTTREISDKNFTRPEMGLPETGFVFACFNNNYKITPDVFDIWMRLLSKIPNSVLWLFEGNTTAAINLRKEAEKRGIAGDRLIFAKRMQLKDHLARHKLADLFLDTFYCNAHTTASDALWAGLPVLTCVGQTFAGRVAGSLLNAIGLSELITETLEQYESLAFEFATNPEKLSAIKNKLSNNRLTSPLFDAALFTQHIEASYTKMMERLLVGLPPDHIHIKD
ncbi:MAG: tetratricopeptide repeat protein [Burkholderiaceae bacterium]